MVQKWDEEKPSPHIMIIEARSYPDITDDLADAAIAELEKSGATYERYQVPGVFEIPAAIQFAIRSMDFYTARKRFDGYVTLGALVKDDSPEEYDAISRVTAIGVQEITTRHTLAVGYGVVIAESTKAAKSLASVKGKNFGARAAKTALDMIRLKEHFALFPR